MTRPAPICVAARRIAREPVQSQLDQVTAMIKGERHRSVRRKELESLAKQLRTATLAKANRAS